MKNNIFKITMILLVAIFSLGFFFANNALKQPLVQGPSLIDRGYIMPRIQKIISFFSLEDRAINYKFENPFETKKSSEKSTKMVATEAAPKSVAVKANNKADAKKIAEKKKKEEAQKAQIQKKQRQEFVKKYEEARKLQAEREKQKSEMNRNPQKSPSVAQQNNYAFTRVTGPATQNSVSQQNNILTDEEKEKVEQREAQEKEAQFWRDTLQKEPTAENALALAQALREEKINADQYFKIIEQLMSSRSAEHEKIGLYLVYNQSSAKVFQVVAQNLATMNEANKVTAKAYLESYNEPQKLSLLGSLLNSSNKVVKTEALGVVKVGVDKIKLGQNPFQVSARNQRAEGYNVQVSLDRYLILIPALQTLAAEQGQEYAATAQQVLVQLQTVVASLK